MNVSGQVKAPLATKSESGRTAVMTSRASGEIQKIATSARMMVATIPPLGFGFRASGSSLGDLGVGQGGDGGDLGGELIERAPGVIVRAAGVQGGRPP